MRILLNIHLSPIIRCLLSNTKTKINNMFTRFESSIEDFVIPAKLNSPFDYDPDSLCLLASKELQNYLEIQNEWDHNFGLDSTKKGTIYGKMFGVLVVMNYKNEIGYLSAFSGKLAGNNHHLKFVPPVYDSLKKGDFLNLGMNELERISNEISVMESAGIEDDSKEMNDKKRERKNHSIALQEKLFDQYKFLNQTGEVQGLREIFNDKTGRNPPSGAGECAAPKLLQFAFKNNMRPVAMAEFWWGQSPKLIRRIHKQFYPACQEKCFPILSHMLEGITLEKN